MNITTHKIDLFVTMVEEHSEVISDIKATFPNAKIEILENKGFEQFCDINIFIYDWKKYDIGIRDRVSNKKETYQE